MKKLLNTVIPWQFSPGVKKKLLFMKLTFVITLATVLQTMAGISYSQTTFLSLNLKDAKVQTVMQQIEDQTEFFFLYSRSVVDVERTVDVKVKNEKIAKVLDVLFSDSDVAYKVDGRQIILSKKSESGDSGAQQQKTITGKITDEEGLPLPGVTVLQKGTTNGTVTNVDGEYSLSNISNESVVIFSFIGMVSQEIVVGTNSTIDVRMATESFGLDEVIAVGYGTQKKESLTGAIASIDDTEIKTTVATSLAQKLSGKVAGLNIRQTSGEPGTFSNSINIRGFGEPLYVIDGIVRGGSADFQRLSSEDIESISVLKDASAAIYGLNAANGVIIVTTKKGSDGDTKFTFSSVVGFSAPTDQPEMANASQYYTMRNDANINAGLAPFIEQEELAKWQAGGAGYESTNWSDATLKNNSVRQEHILSAQGGSEKITFYLNVGIVDDNGLLKTNDINYSKFNFRSNISAKLTENLTADVNFSGFSDKRESPIQGIFNIWRGTVSGLPSKPVYANNNPEYLHRVQDGQAMNPVALAQSDLGGYAIFEDNKFQTTASLTYDAPFLEGLVFKAVAGFDKSFHQSKTVSTDYELYDYKEEDDSYLPTAFNKPSSITNGYNNSYLLTFQAQAIYKTTINENHNVGATLVYEQRKVEGRHAGILKYYEFFTNAQIDQAGEENAASWGNEWQQRSKSYLGRLNYNYQGKYLIEFAARYDGSYRYHPDQRWGFFPVVSGGWRVSDENFIKDNITWLSNFKIRGSYGIIGQDTGEPFQYVQGFSTSGGGHWEYNNGVLTNGASTPAIVNEQLTWMESSIKDIGIDMGFFENKLSIIADIYQRDRTGLLAYRNVSLPNTFGGTLPQENLNSDRVRGIEFSFVYRNTVGEFNYSIAGNVNFARSMNVYVESTPFNSSWEEYRAGSGRDPSTIESKASNRWNDIVWMLNNTGQFQDEEEILYAPIQNGSLGNSRELPGDFKYEDLNGDGVIDGNDMAPSAYNESPKTNFGLTLNGTWKGFDLSILFQGAANYTARYAGPYTTMFWQEGNTPAYFVDRWHKSDPYDTNSEWIPGKWPATRVQQDLGMIYAESQVWRRSASYLRIKNIELGYTLNQPIINKIGIENIRFFTNINNLYTFTDSFIKPFDPESISRDNGVGFGWSYPLLKTFNFGLSINF